MEISTSSAIESTIHSVTSEVALLSDSDEKLSQSLLDRINVEQSREQNKKNLDKIGGIDELARLIGTNFDTGLSMGDVIRLREKFGTNKFPESPMKSFFRMLLETFQDVTLIILMIAAIVSLSIGLYDDPKHGWIEGTAILCTIVLVSVVTAGNDYSKELQFRNLEKSSQVADRTSVLREGRIMIVNPAELVVGDIIVLQVTLSML